MHGLEDWLSAVLRYCKSVTCTEIFEAELVDLLIIFLNINKIWKEKKIVLSDPHEERPRSKLLSRSDTMDNNLFSLIKAGDLETFHGTLDHYIQTKGSDVLFHEKNSKGETLLHIACAIDREDIVQLLVNLGADVNCVSTDFEDTPLHFACFEGNINIFKLLVNHGAKVDTANRSGKTPLHYACRYSFELVKFLLEHGANYLVKNHDNQTALHVSCAYCVEAASYLLTIGRGLDINEKDSSGCSPLHSAVIGGSTANDPNRLHLIKQLIELQADIHAVDGTGKNVVLLCCVTGDLELLKLFLEKGVSLVVLDHQNRNALHIAIQSSSEGIVSFLMHECADIVDVFHTDDSGENSLHKAASASNDAIFDMIWDKFMQSEYKSLINAPNGMGFTPLHFACMNGRMRVVDILLNAGADVSKTNEVCIEC